MKPLSFYKSLHDAKARRERGVFLVEGIRAVTQIAQSHSESIIELLVEEKKRAPAELKYPVRFISPSQFRAICTSAAPCGPLAVVKIPGGAYSSSLPDDTGVRVLALEDVQDPGNVGALVRSAAAFDFSGVLLSDKCADPFGPKAVQASAGSVLSVWVRRTKEFHAGVRGLAEKGFYCIAADVRGTETLHSGGSPKFVLILGNEGNGISADVLACSHSIVRIPINAARVESLNVAASGAVCMYALAGLRG
ncbi:MAG TPA: RNA methyltransferase [Chitinivibrionales bacterium]|nr:RNA methyltransferase [Chitinivibrionales bacterium]